MLKWSLRIGLGLVCLLAFVVAVAFVDCSLWTAGIVRGIENDPDRRVAATARGDIEYVVAGEGTPVLVLHGGVGGYDMGVLLARRAFAGEGLPTKTIAVSRPGYLGTPLSSGVTPEEQADLYAALLDELGVDRVIVSGWSSGGRLAAQFALRHPERTAGLLLVSTSIRTTDSTAPDLGEAGFLVADMYLWAVAKLFPRLMIDNYDRGDPDQVANLRATLRTIAPVKLRWAGNLNDVAQGRNPAVDGWPLEEISAPTLIVHGDADPRSSYSNALEAAARIPHVRLFTIEGGGHMGFRRDQREAIRTEIGQFFESLANETAGPSHRIVAPRPEPAPSPR